MVRRTTHTRLRRHALRLSRTLNLVVRPYSTRYGDAVTLAKLQPEREILVCTERVSRYVRRLGSSSFVDPSCRSKESSGLPPREGSPSPGKTSVDSRSTPGRPFPRSAPRDLPPASLQQGRWLSSLTSPTHCARRGLVSSLRPCSSTRLTLLRDGKQQPILQAIHQQADRTLTRKPAPGRLRTGRGRDRVDRVAGAVHRGCSGIHYDVVARHLE